MPIEYLKKIKKELDWEEISYKFEARSTIVEVAEEFGVAESTLHARCEKDLGIKISELVRLSRATGTTNLRVKQYSSAMDGNNQMLLLLGRIWLDQKDKENKDNGDEISLLREMLAEIIRNNKGIPGVSGSKLETEQPILDQGLPREESQIQPELGTEGTSEG
jgi:hypothetical protein